MFSLLIKIAIHLACICIFSNFSAVEGNSYQDELEQISKEPLDKQRELLFDLAKKYESNNQTDEAIIVYRQIISSDECLKNAITAWLAIADIYKKQNQCQKSLAELEAMSTLLPGNKEVQQKKFNLLVELARSAAEKKNYKESTIYFKSAIAAYPEYRLQVLQEYADQLTLNSEANSAIPLYHEILASNLTDDEKKKALIGLAGAYTWAENYPEAIETNKKVLEIDPHYNQYDFFLTLARDAATHKKPELSVEYYQKAIEADPTKRNTLIREYAKQLSYAYRAEEAIVLYKEVLNTELSPEENRLIRLDLAQAYVWTKQFPLAIAEYEILLSQNPKDTETRKAFVDLAISFARFDAQNYKHTSAINWYLTAMSLNPEIRSSLLREYADQVSRSGQGPEAIILYKGILFSGPSKEEVRLTNLGLAQTYIWVNKHEDALNIYDELLKLNPNDLEAKKGKVQVYVNYARYDASQGNRLQAIHWFKKAIELVPEEKSNIEKELADQLFYNSQVDESIELYKEILTRKPTGDYERDVRLSLAKAYTSKFLYEEALEQYDILLQRNKFDQIVKQGKAKIYVDYALYNSKLGKHNEAIDWYNKAIENDPIRRPELQLKIDEEKRLIPGYKVEETPQKIENKVEAPAPVDIESKDTPIQIPACEAKKEDIQESAPQIPSTEEHHYSLEPTDEHPSALPSNVKEQKPDEKPVKEESPQECAKQAQKTGEEYAKTLNVFEANRAFEASVAIDPNNRSNREQYAWHLQAFSFIEEAVYQFNILLPCASDPALFYLVLGWDYHMLGELDASIWAFSQIYDFPYCYTQKNKFVVIRDIYRRSEYEKIHALWSELECADKTKELEIKKKLFESYTYIEELCVASILALDILSTHPEEYMVHYRYAKLLHQKKKYSEAVYQYELLLEKLPCNAFLYLSLGKVYEDWGCICAAKIAYENAFYLDQNPKTERAYARVLSKCGDCCNAIALANQIDVDESDSLTKSLSVAEVSLNCGYAEIAACIYNEVLENYPYNREALWGLLKSSTHTGNTDDALVSYKRWPTVWFDDPLQNQLAEYYRPPEMLQSNEYFHNSITFRRFSTGLSFNQYHFCNMRLSEGYYYTQFGQRFFNTINRHTGFLTLNKLFNRKWECRLGLLENYYDRLQHRSEDPFSTKQHLYSKAVLNCRLHLIAHPIPELTADIGYDYYDIIDTIPPFNNPIYNYIIQIGAAALNIRTADWNAFFYYYKEKFYWLANIVYGKYSDGNVKKTRSFRTGYQVYEVAPTNVYYSYFYLDYKKSARLFVQNGHSERAYFDPKNFEVHSIGLDTKYDITECLQVGGEVSTLYIPKCRNFAYSVFAFLNYEFTDCLSCRLDLRYYYQNQSITRSEIIGYYNAENASLQIKYQF